MAKRKPESDTTAQGKRPTAFAMDGKGRRIEVQALNALEFYDLAKVLGTTTSEVAESMAATVATVRKIDTTPYALPATESEVRFLIQTLDFDGIAAAGIALSKLRKTEADVDGEVAAAKNSAGDPSSNSGSPQ